GGPLYCAAMEATLEVIESENLTENAARMGEYLRENLLEIPIVQEVLGRGLLVGVRVAEGMTAKKLQGVLLKQHILAGSSMDPQVLRMMPPLTITTREADLFVEAVQTA
ncbi:MAG: aminotransferase class III-fold pyridoxal phosphate-dependent enzyme, partial [Acidobacteria bacterium]|nr:aminotransferase class III-fold pyridoxal phosphate-dependent enzyme [Acidobacteriota bacterium]